MTSSRRLSLAGQGDGDSMMLLPANITPMVICLIMLVWEQKHNCFINRFMAKLFRAFRVELHQFQISNRLAAFRTVDRNKQFFLSLPNPSCRWMDNEHITHRSETGKLFPTDGKPYTTSNGWCYTHIMTHSATTKMDTFRNPMRSKLGYWWPPTNRLTLLVSRARSNQTKATIDIGIRGESEATAFSRKTVTSNWMCLLPLGCPHFPVTELWYTSHSNGDQRTVKKRPFGFLSSHVGKCVVVVRLSDCSIFLSEMDFSNNFTIRTHWLTSYFTRTVNQPTNPPSDDNQGKLCGNRMGAQMEKKYVTGKMRCL